MKKIGLVTSITFQNILVKISVFFLSEIVHYYLITTTSRCASLVFRGHKISSRKPSNNHFFSSIFSLIQALILQTSTK